ncbi:hypothetical protein FQZ97_809500 [compost metagenome]
MMKVVPGCCHMKRSAWCGLSAARISGWSTICTTPRPAMVTNHTTVIGPKNLPMPPVPRFCTANSANSTTSVIGTTYWRKAGEMTSRPSTADNTEMAGVMTPSP